MPRALVTGGGGFLGSHLCDRLLAEGWEVICLDSMLTGSEDNLTAAFANPSFSYDRYDVTNFLYVDGPVDWVFHFASPASPRDYQEHSIKTLKVGGIGTWRALGLARAKGAGFFLASTSEVYGDPQVHPQPEDYWGHVNPVGVRSMYDEAKRYAEAMTMAYHRSHGIPVRIIRIFNTYGPRLQRADGRAVPNFVNQALNGNPLTIHGDGSQTRSLCFVDDLVEGIWRFTHADFPGPLNLGNPEEVTILQLATLIAELAGTRSEVIYEERPTDDPEVRCPDISLAQKELGWKPEIDLREGLQRTIEWARPQWISTSGP